MLTNSEFYRQKHKTFKIIIANLDQLKTNNNNSYPAFSFLLLEKAYFDILLN